LSERRIGFNLRETEDRTAVEEERRVDQITEPDALRTHFGAVDSLAKVKVLPKLDGYCRSFIERSPFLVLATADGEGGLDASPRGDAPGFVAILDDATLVLPDRPGNRRVDSFGNILANPGVALLFFVPGLPETLRVNGTARVVTDAKLLTPLAAQGKVPTAGLLISVSEAFFHCGKALIRGKLWDANTQIARADFPSLGQIIADQTRAIEAAEADTFVEQAYRTTLY
jgi:PPOX class probable FMN-dependent enzyme